MTIIASESTMSVTTVEQKEEMATTVLMVEWMVKQLQFLQEKQRQIEALQQENEQLKDSLDKLKNRDSQNSSIPPSQDLLKKPSNKSKLLAPTRSSAELKSLLGEDFDGIKSSDCEACLQSSKSEGETEMLNPF